MFSYKNGLNSLINQNKKTKNKKKQQHFIPSRIKIYFTISWKIWSNLDFDGGNTSQTSWAAKLTGIQTNNKIKGALDNQSDWSVSNSDWM